MKEVISGQRVGLLQVVAEADRVVDGHGRSWRMVRVQCDCGTVKCVRFVNFAGGKTMSCGCLKREQMREVARQRFSAQEGLAVAERSLYGTWSHMLDRCESSSCKDYRNYGGRGIKVCERWHDFRTFVSDVKQEIGPRPARHLFDRRDNDGNYEPGNVRWASRSLSNVNTRRRRSGVMGVTPLPSGRWQARISIGVFATPEEASASYQQARAALAEAGLL